MMKARGRPRHPDLLTPREWEVLTLVREGLTNPEIAERMGITLDGAKYHVSEILSKLHLGSREEAAAWQPEPPRATALRPSWANALGGWWPLMARIAGAGVTVAAVIGLGVLAYGVIKNEGEEEPSVGAAPSATAAPSPGPQSEAEQIIAEGTLQSYAATESGTVLTVWGTCHDPDCPWAWRLGTGSRPQATGMVSASHVHVEAIASGDGFILISDQEPWLRIAQDGTASPISTECEYDNWPDGPEPGRRVWASGLNVVDTVTGAVCHSGRLSGPPLARGAFTADGALWALIDGARQLTGDADILTIGRYDGVEWRYHDFAAQSGSGTSVLAAAGSNVVVLLANPEPSPRPDQLVGLAVTTDDGATWTEILDPDVLERDLPFSTFVSASLEDLFSGYTSVAFAGTSTLYVADGRGDLWRSSDFATFSQVEVPGQVSGLKSAGDAVIARLDSVIIRLDNETCGSLAACQINDLVRISADGRVEVITSR